MDEGNNVLGPTIDKLSSYGTSTRADSGGTRIGDGNGTGSGGGKT